MILIAIALLAVIPHQGVVVDSCDVVEINHVYPVDGKPGSKPSFSQLIWLDFDEKTGTHQVVDWRMMRTPHMRPHFDERDGLWKLCWYDNANGNCWRRVDAKAIRETHGHTDWEIEQRAVLPADKRRKLTMPKRPEINRRTTE